MMKTLTLAGTLAVPALALSVLALPATAPAQGPYRTDRAQPIAVTMTDQGFLPRRIALRGGAPYVLRIANRSGKGHNFTQKAFFANAGMGPDDRFLVRDGQVSLKPGESFVIHFRAPDTRPGGTYEFVSTVLGDADSDYKGTFLIR